MSPPMQGGFDANAHTPRQVVGSHPVGKFPFQLSNTEITENKDKNGGFLAITFQTPAGEIIKRYNLWNQSEVAVKIANGELSALCHATGIFRVEYTNEGAAFRGGRGMIDVGYQKGQEPTTENPEGGYTEIKRVYDSNGNEPGKATPAPQPASTAQAQPMTQQNGGWGNSQPATPNNAAANTAPSGWGNNGQPQGANQPAPWNK